jgi:hypothetical protein
MKVFARRCLELAEESLRQKTGNKDRWITFSFFFLHMSIDPTDYTTPSPIRPIVDMKIVNQCRKEVNPSMSALLNSLPKQSLLLLVSLALSYPMGQLFSLCDMHDAINAFYAKRKMRRIDLNTMCLYGESLLEYSLLHTHLAGEKKQNVTSLNQLQRHSEVCRLTRPSFLFSFA